MIGPENFLFENFFNLLNPVYFCYVLLRFCYSLLRLCCVFVAKIQQDAAKIQQNRSKTQQTTQQITLRPPRASQRRPLHNTLNL